MILRLKVRLEDEVHFHDSINAKSNRVILILIGLSKWAAYLSLNSTKVVNTQMLSSTQVGPAMLASLVLEARTRICYKIIIAATLSTQLLTNYAKLLQTPIIQEDW